MIKKNEKKPVRFLDQVKLNDDEYFNTVKSSASCKIEDIVGFTYGAQSSRFWMLRKYLISMS